MNNSINTWEIVTSRSEFDPSESERASIGFQPLLWRVGYISTQQSRNVVAS